MTAIPRRARTPIALLAAVLIGASTAACGSSGPPAGGDVTYAPAAYGQQVGGAYDCYWIDDPYEVTDPVTGLIAKGLCPAGSIATAATLGWRETYWGYYSSPAYYNTYMPVRYRTRYTSVTIVRFGSTYKTQIASASSKAVYKSSTGQKVTGTSKVKFGSGSGSSAVHGGGSGRVGTCSQAMTTVQMRGGSSGSGGSHGGGSGRSGGSGSSGSKSGSGSGSRGGC